MCVQGFRRNEVPSSCGVAYDRCAALVHFLHLVVSFPKARGIILKVMTGFSELADGARDGHRTRLRRKIVDDLKMQCPHGHANED